MAAPVLENVYILSPMQQGLLFHSLYTPAEGLYIDQVVAELPGRVDAAALERAWRHAVARHAVLRTSFHWQGLDKPLQVVHPAVQLPFAVHDWRGEGPDRLERYLEEDRRRGFDLGKSPLLRLALTRTGEDRHLLIWTYHHILLDAWSGSVLMGDVMTAYQAFAAGREPEPRPARPFGEYIAWLRRQDPAAAETFWRARLAGFQNPTPLALPGASGDSEPGPEIEHAERTVELPAEATAALRVFARHHHLTLNTLVQGAWALLLHLYSGEDDVVFGSTVSGRPAEIAGIEAMVGLFINTLPVRARIDPAAGLVPWLRSIQAWQSEMQPFEHSPLAEVQTWSGVPAGRPLFESIVVFENVPTGGSNGDGPSGNEGSSRYLSRNNYPLSLVVLPADRLSVRALYDRRRFPAAGVERALGHLARLLAAIAAASPDARLDELSPLSPEERRQVVEAFNATAVPYPREAAVHQLFAAVAAERPDAVALEETGLSVTYAELSRRAGRLAGLLQSLGVGPETPVGLCAERSVDLVVGMTGILQAGGAYVPLDPAYPEDRLTFLAEDARLPVLVTRGRETAGLPPALRRLPTVLLDGEALARGDAAPDLCGGPDSLAYLMYTSGSTGQPKGVEAVHRAVVRLVRSGDGYARFAPDEVFLHLAPPAFDAATFEVWGALLHGARLAILPGRAPTLAELAEAVRRHGVTTLWATTGLFHQIVENGLDGLCGLRRLMTGGDVTSPAHVRRALAELPGCTLVHAYGPTENTTFTTCQVLTAPDQVEEPLPIGPPIANSRVYLLDRAFRPVPVGVAGELYTAGDGLARGYLRRPGLTAERFVPDPFEPGGRLYRTGDLARWRGDGTIEFLGRLDNQVKIRGFRVEPGEVEAVLDGHPAVRQAAVIPRRDLPGGKALVAYVVLREPTAPGELRAFLQERLPEFMVPSFFVELAEMPLDPNAKTDRRALARLDLIPEAARAGRTYMAPRNPIEELLASLWFGVLGAGRVGAHDDVLVGVHDDFLELGGHSLLATQLLSRIREAFQVELPLAVVFEEPTVAGQAGRIEEALREKDDSEPPPPLVPVARDVPLPLSFAQQRLWILDRFDPGLPAYNIPLALRLAGPFSPAALDAALAALLARHEALRTHFAVAGGGEPVQVIDPPDAWRGLPFVDLSALPSQLREAELDRLAGDEAGRRFDLARGPLLRSALVRLQEEEHALLLTVHHIVADGWSMGILYRELAVFYEGRPGPPPLPVQYADYAVWQREWLSGGVLERQLAWWRERLAGLPAGIDLPLDRPRPALQTFRGGRVPLALPPGLSNTVRELARGERATLFMTLLAALQELLGRLSGRDDLAVGTPVANRNRGETEGLIGFFVNTLVLRADLGGEPTVRQLLARVREGTLAAYTHQDVPFEKLVEELKPERSLALTPFFQVLFTLESPPTTEGLAGIAPAQLPPHGGSAKFDLTFSLVDLADGIAGVVEHNADLFEPATAARLAGYLETLLAGFAAHPERPAAFLPLLTEAERHQLAAEANDNRIPVEEGATLSGLFARQAEKTPEAPALRWGAESLTYRELRRRAGELAAHLRRLGVGPEVPVGVFLDRRPEMIVGLLGILEAGGAYVPLDPAYPRERLALTLDDCKAPVVLTREDLADRLPGDAVKVLLGGGASPPGRGEEGSGGGQVGGSSNNLAYLIYTSGSTGRPKGVAIEHRSAVAFLAWAREVFSDAEVAAVLASTSICFDLSVFEIFVPLTRGGTVVLAGNALDLLEMEDGAGVTLVNTVPSAAAELTRNRPLPASVRTLNLAGEPIPAALAERLAALPGLRLYNLYGPSEATTYSTWERVRGGEHRSPAIGRPVAGTTVHLLDRRLRPVPAGVPGELYIGGAGLARGYFGRPDLTAASFVPDPFGPPGARLYRTGDLSRALPDGRLDFLGRIDHQVKVRGFRIELGEVETALARHPEVAAAAAAVHGRGEDRRLVAYVVPRDGDLSAGELRTFVQGALPGFMVPSDFVSLPALPLGATGKVDRARLPAPEGLRLGSAAAWTAPGTELEQTIAAVVREVLGVERVGLHDNFFELGAHSLLMVRAAGALEERLGRRVAALDLFRFPTVAALSYYWSVEEAPEPRETLEQLEQRGEERRQGRSRRRELRRGQT
ncbi:MAG TPA: amino acid adenylation domain-containing protein [Thermoanaerobaculia bacterium]|nr:amino acid adenylation domain-containing protein [Thermoanaerobaculia bacterium]